MSNPDQIYFSGDYADWTEALKECEVHPTEPVLERILAATLKIRGNRVIQQGVFSGRVACNFPLLTALLSAAIDSPSHFHVLDFGGSLGISYFHSRSFLRQIPRITWSVIELPELVAAGKKHFASEELWFYENIEDCGRDSSPDVIILSGVLQYLPDPWGTLQNLLQLKAPFLFIDRTALIQASIDRLMIQHLPEWIYRIDLPAWFLSESKLIAALSDGGYECLCDFPAIDHYAVAGVTIGFKGFIAQLLQ